MQERCHGAAVGPGADEPKQDGSELGDGDSPLAGTPPTQSTGVGVSTRRSSYFTVRVPPAFRSRAELYNFSLGSKRVCSNSELSRSGYQASTLLNGSIFPSPIHRKYLPLKWRRPRLPLSRPRFEPPSPGPRAVYRGTALARPSGLGARGKLWPSRPLTRGLVLQRKVWWERQAWIWERGKER